MKASQDAQQLQFSVSQ